MKKIIVGERDSIINLLRNKTNVLNLHEENIKEIIFDEENENALNLKKIAKTNMIVARQVLNV